MFLMNIFTSLAWPRRPYFRVGALSTQKQDPDTRHYIFMNSDWFVKLVKIFILEKIGYTIANWFHFVCMCVCVCVCVWVSECDCVCLCVAICSCVCVCLSACVSFFCFSYCRLYDICFVEYPMHLLTNG